MYMYEFLEVSKLNIFKVIKRYAYPVFKKCSLIVDIIKGFLYVKQNF